jgi:hypothetical protein
MVLWWLPSQEGQEMMGILWAVIHCGKIELAKPAELPKEAKVLVALLPEDDSRFWADASQKSLAAAWDNAEDDTHAQLVLQ